MHPDQIIHQSTFGDAGRSEEIFKKKNNFFEGILWWAIDYSANGVLKRSLFPNHKEKLEITKLFFDVKSSKTFWVS